MKELPEKEISTYIVGFWGDTWIASELHKIDKIKETIVEKNIELYKKELLRKWKKLPEIFITSSKKQIGRKKILTYISKINNSLLK